MKGVFDNRKVWNYLESYCKDRAIRFAYWSKDRLIFYTYDKDKGRGENSKGAPYANMNKHEFTKTYERVCNFSRKYANANPVAIYATLSRFSKFPNVKNNFGAELGRFCLARDLGLDVDFGIENVNQLDKILRDSCEIIQLIWGALIEIKLRPTLKTSGTGFHVVAPVEIGHGDTSKEVQHLGRFVIEKSLSNEYECKLENNEYQIFKKNSNEKFLCKIEVHKDLTRVFTIPFSPYAKVEKLKGSNYEGKIILCVPLTKPEEILNFHPVTLEHLDCLDDLKITKYPSPVEISPELMNEVEEYFEQKYSDYQRRNSSPESKVTLDNLPKKYKHLQNGVKKGCRDSSVTTLIGVFKTCGLSKSEALAELLKFNGRCNPPLDVKIVKEKVGRFYSIK